MKESEKEYMAAEGRALMDEALRRDQAVEEGRAHYLDETDFLRGIHRK